VDHLLDAGFIDLTVSDISEEALAVAKTRLGVSGDAVEWIAADVTDHPEATGDPVVRLDGEEYVVEQQDVATAAGLELVGTTIRRLVEVDGAWLGVLI
jgi:hypothetical protein